MTELRRGDVVYYGERGEFSGKLRPGVVIQRNATLEDAPSITICGITSTAIPDKLARVALIPSPANGLEMASFVMVDKIASIRRQRVRQIFGRLDPEDLIAVDRALRLWLDL
jgi:mRNA interferase MazF